MSWVTQGETCPSWGLARGIVGWEEWGHLSSAQSVSMESC